MKYEIFGGSFPAAEVTLDSGETVVTQSGALGWCDSSVEMSTNMEGGLLKGLGRMFSGASLMLVRHTATHDNSKLTFTASFPGTIREFKVDAEHEYIAQKSAFLVSDPTVEIDAALNKKFLAGLFGGEGFILQHYKGEGSVLAEIDGSVQEILLEPGQTIKVETAHVAAFESTVAYDVQTVKGLKNVLFGGQGLVMTTLTGPGRVWLQTLTAFDFAQRIIPYLPKPSTTTIRSDD